MDTRYELASIIDCMISRMLPRRFDSTAVTKQHVLSILTSVGVGELAELTLLLDEHLMRYFSTADRLFMLSDDAFYTVVSMYGRLDGLDAAVMRMLLAYSIMTRQHEYVRRLCSMRVFSPGKDVKMIVQMLIFADDLEGIDMLCNALQCDLRRVLMLVDGRDTFKASSAAEIISHLYTVCKYGSSAMTKRIVEAYNVNSEQVKSGLPRMLCSPLHNLIILALWYNNVPAARMLHDEKYIDDIVEGVDDTTSEAYHPLPGIILFNDGSSESKVERLRIAMSRINHVIHSVYIGNASDDTLEYKYNMDEGIPGLVAYSEEMVRHADDNFHIRLYYKKPSHGDSMFCITYSWHYIYMSFSVSCMPVMDEAVRVLHANMLDV